MNNSKTQLNMDLEKTIVYRVYEVKKTGVSSVYLSNDRKRNGILLIEGKESITAKDLADLFNKAPDNSKMEVVYLKSSFIQEEWPVKESDIFDRFLCKSQ
jgi:hypothetical protein